MSLERVTAPVVRRLEAMPLTWRLVAILLTLLLAALLAGIDPSDLARVSPTMRAFPGPVTFVWGMADRAFTPALGRRLAAAFGDGRPSPLSAFLRMGDAYLRFAAEKPGYYMAMFESGLSIAGNADLAAAAERAEDALTRAAEALFQRVPPDRRPPSGMVAHHIWAMSHGVVELFGRGRPGSRAPISASEMLESGVLIYLRGLGLIQD